MLIDSGCSYLKGITAFQTCSGRVLRGSRKKEYTSWPAISGRGEKDRTYTRSIPIFSILSRPAYDTDIVVFCEYKECRVQGEKLELVFYAHFQSHVGPTLSLFVTPLIVSIDVNYHIKVPYTTCVLFHLCAFKVDLLDASLSSGWQMMSSLIEMWSSKGIITGGVAFCAL